MEIQKKNILVVDDSETNVILLRGVLERSGYEVKTASNGKQALEKAESGMPDLILLDLMMPLVDGYKFLEQIKANERLKEIPVFVITAKVETSDLRKAIDLGAVDYMTKPIRIKTLKEKIQHILGLADDSEA